MIVFILSAAFLISIPPVDSFLDKSMVGKAFVQTFSLIALGILLGRAWESFKFRDNSERISGLILFSFLYLFWSIPRSVDLSEIYWWMDQLYHLSMFVGGFFLYKGLENLNNVVRGVYGLLFSSMLVSSAMVYRWKREILCSTYTLQDQNLYGNVLLPFGILIYVSVILWIIFGWSRKGS